MLGGGYCGSRAVSSSCSVEVTAQSRYHLWSAGITYQGAVSVEVAAMVSANAVW